VQRPATTFVSSLFSSGYTGVYDHSAGVPIHDRYGKAYKKKLPPLGDPHVIAGRLTKEAWHARGGKQAKVFRSRPLSTKWKYRLMGGAAVELVGWGQRPLGDERGMTSSLTRILSTRVSRRN
jgi:hypothetical protein